MNDTSTPMKKIQNLKDWMNIETPRIKIVHSEEFGYGVFATEEILPGEMILEVPSKFYLTSTNAMTFMPDLIHFKHDSLKEDIPIELLVREILSLFLVLDDQNPNSEWRPFYDVLPTDFPSLLINWEPSEYENLMSFNGIPRRVEIFNTNLDKFYIRAINWINKYRPGFKLTKEKLKWAVLQVQTRTWGFEIYKEYAVMLVPFMDLFNHDPIKGSLCHISDNSISVSAKIKYAPGDQIWLSYGNKPNIDLVDNYGFYLEDNPFSNFFVSINDFLCSDRLCQFLISNLPEIQQGILLNKEATTVQSLLKTFRLSMIKYQDLSYLSKVLENECASPAIERGAIRDARIALKESFDAIKLEQGVLKKDVPHYSVINFLYHETLHIIESNIAHMEQYWLSILHNGSCGL